MAWRFSSLFGPLISIMVIFPFLSAAASVESDAGGILTPPLSHTKVAQAQPGENPRPAVRRRKSVPVTDETFERDVLKSPLPVLVEFWAEWAGPSKMIAPSIEALAREFAGRLVVAKLNVDDSPRMPATYGVRGIPMLILFRDGRVIARKVGAFPEGELSAWVSGQLGE